LKDTDKVKARLLYYYPLSSKKIDYKNDNNADSTSNDESKIKDNIPPTEDSWIGWHNDSGFLTALAGDIYVNHVTGQRILSPQDIDPHSGLYVLDRSAWTGGTNETPIRLLKVNVPYDCCAIQIGECVQIITGGTLCATPHCVRGCSSSNIQYHNIARISLPCFIDTHPSFPLVPPVGITRQQVLNADQFSHSKVPPLALRWKQTTSGCDLHDRDDDGTVTTTVKPMTFGEFLQETFQMYYGWETVATSS
jgi:isopenicillin N synthase-like dioxygenase